MYSRKIKLSKKKTKNSITKPGGSNWGPRIALYEREKAHRSQAVQSQSIQQQQQPHHHHQAQSASSSSTVPSSSSSSVPPPNNCNYEYNFSRSSVATSSSSQLSHTGHQNARLLLQSNRGNSRHSVVSQSSSSHSASTKALSASSNPNGSNTYISTNDVLTKPLTLVIPPPDRFGYGFEEFGFKCDDSLPSTHTYRSSGEEIEPSPLPHPKNNEHHCKRTVVQVEHRDINSNTKKTGKENAGKINANGNLYGTNPSAAAAAAQLPPTEFGILTVSTTESQVHTLNHPSPTEMMEPDTMEEPETMNIEEINQDNGSGTYERYEDYDYHDEGERDHQEITITQSQSEYSTTGRLGNDAMAMAASGTATKSKINGSTIAALAQGITMVYVPMESLPRNSTVRSGAGSSSNGKLVAIASTSNNNNNNVAAAGSEYGNTIASGKSQTSEPRDNNANVIDAVDNEDVDSIDQDLANNLLAMEIKDPDGDSLLESFDSILFKPKSSVGSTSSLSDPSPPLPIAGPSSNPVVTVTIAGATAMKKKPQPPLPPPKKVATPSNIYGKPKQMISERPPPLPPKNSIYSNLPVETDKQKSLRFALESLDTLNNETYGEDRLGGQFNYHGYSNGHGKKLKKVTLTLPGANPPREHELLINYDDLMRYSSSAVLSCGHYKNDNYSTLSSINSAQVSDVEEGEEDEHYPNKGTIGNQEDEGENDSLSNTPVDSRSALQQLRDLSLLIGGNFHSATIDEDFRYPPLIDQNGKTSKGKSRRDSDATDNSADSGKGSGSGRTPTESSPQGDASNSSPNSSPNSNSTSHVKCSCGNRACVFRPDCTECLLFNRTQPFEKPDSSEELCSNSNDEGSGKVRVRRNGHTHSHSVNANFLKKQTKLKRTNSRPLVTSSTRSARPKPKKSVILDYCECKNCGNNNNKPPQSAPSAKNRTANGTDYVRVRPDYPQGRHSSASISRNAVKVSKLSKTAIISRTANRRISSATLTQAQMDPNFLFTIEEDEEMPNVSNGGNYGRTISTTNATNNSTAIPSNSSIPNGSNKNSFFLNVQMGKKVGVNRANDTYNNNRHVSSNNKNGHWHPQCWLAPDATMGWSDLESLYSQNMKSDQPIMINDECWTCWKELSEHKHNSSDPNRTVDRTKRMFIWLNRRHKEFHAPWWEAKKQASIRWLVTKAFAHLPKAVIEDPFKESKKGKPSKYRLRDEVIKGLVNGKLYCMTLDNLYQSSQQQQQFHSKQGLTHWDIIKILSRRGVYVASPSDMKLTEGTLRQRKPIRIAAHIALIEAIMGLYAKEILGRERILATLKSFGRNATVEPDNSTSEQLVIAWINAAMLTLKSYIISKKNQKLPSARIHRWLHVPEIDEIRDLCDGVGICSLFALYCSNDIKVSEISVPEPGEPLTIYDSISNHSLVQKLCEDLFPEPIYHLCVTDFLYIHGYMKQNILCFLVDLFNHLEINPAIRVNRLTHVPIRIEL